MAAKAAPGEETPAAESSPAAIPALQTRGLGKSFRGLIAVDRVDLSIAKGARHALIGPNGAGKTTLVNLICGHIKATTGDLLIHGRPATHLPEHRRTKLGLARTFQINQLFRQLTVMENVLSSVSERSGASRGFWRSIGSDSALVDECCALLEMVGLLDDALRPVAELSYGRQRLVEIAITLAQRPSVLLLDEPTAGIPAGESRQVLEVIDTLSDEITVLIIEHDMEMVFRFAKRITVMMNGAILKEGSPDEIAADAEVRAVYLGEGGYV